MSKNVVWELSSKGELVSLVALDPTGKVSKHCFDELETGEKEYRESFKSSD